MKWKFGDGKAKRKPLDALGVDNSIIVYHIGDDDTVLWETDATRTLYEFAIWCAGQVLEKVGNPDPRSLDALRVKKMWIDGKATDDELNSARTAAGAAAWAAVGDAAWAAALAAVRTTAHDAAWAAWAAGAAARESGVAAREAQNTELERRLLLLAPSATAKYGGICRHCGTYDEYPECGTDGKICCWRCTRNGQKF